MDDSDSLFEGMVLFNPDSSFSDEQPVLQHHPPIIVPESESEPPPISLDTASSEPLEESLFSDLTITSSEPSLPGLSKQISRKKKRASLRIGYGRDSAAAAAEEKEDDGGGGDDQSVGDQSDDSEEARVAQIKARIAASLEAARGEAAAVSEARKEAVSRRRVVAGRLRVASEARAELERRLDEACESEDFEAAEKLSEDLASAEADRVSLVAKLRDAETQCDAVETRMEAALASLIGIEEECGLMLGSFAKDALNKVDLVARTAQEASSREMEIWDSSTEALEVRRMELEIETQIVSEAHGGLNAFIENLVEDDKKERESLCKKKDVLVDELRKLLLLVKQKEEEIAETESNIEAVDEKIAGVMSGFQEMQSDAVSKAGSLQSGLSKIEAESGDLLTRKKEIDDVLAQEEEKAAKLRELAKASAEEAETYLDIVGLRKNLMISVLKSWEDKVKLAKTEEKLSDEVQMLQQVISASRASLQELSTRKSSIQQEIASSKQKLLFIDKRIPELEAEKKVAAAARNFKEAARIAAEAKSLTVENNGILVDMERSNLELEKLEGEITDTVEKLQETESLVSLKEKEVAMARFERLLLIEGSAKAERSAALEFGNQEEAALLLAEAEAADSEAKALQPVYDFKVEEFTNVPKHFISMELVAKLGKKQLEELTASVQFSPA